MRIAVYEMRLMLKCSIRYASLFFIEFFSRVDIRILLNTCIYILGCLYKHTQRQLFLFLLMISINIDSSPFPS